MSKKTEDPRIWSETSYHFNVQEAIDHGIDEAILMQNIRFWLRLNRANGTNEHDGYYWMFNSARAFEELMPFWNLKRTQRVILSLKKKGLIMIGNYNRAKFDRTAWYSMPEFKVKEKPIGHIREIEETDMSNVCNSLPTSVKPITRICPTHYPDMSNALPGYVQTIPDINTNIKKDINKNINTNIKQEVAIAPKSGLKYPCLKKISEVYRDSVSEALEFWAKEMGINANFFKDEEIHQKRAATLQRRFKEGASMSDFKNAVEGCKQSPHHMGQNTQNKIYNDIRYICKPENWVSWSKNEQNENGRGEGESLTEEGYERWQRDMYGDSYDEICLNNTNRTIDQDMQRKSIEFTARHS